MSILENLPDKLRNIFNEGLDEVIIFAIVFIIILVSGHEDNNSGLFEDNGGLFPLLIIGAFLLLFTGFSRSEET
jgi:glycerol uptake facilitator-like aquaporin